MKTSSALLVIIVVLSASPAPSELHKVREIHYQMGTLLDVTLYHSDPQQGRRILRGLVREVRRLEGILSSYDPESSLSFLNRRAGLGKTKVEGDLFRLLKMAARFSLQTSGYFDVTVGPLVDLWRRAGKKGRLPDPRALARAVELVGYRKLRLYDDGKVAMLLRGMKIDLGGIGKGYALDRIVQILRRMGVKRGLISFGGSSIYGLGSPPGDQSWTLQINGTEGKLAGVVHLRDRALSTSGSMGRFWEIGGKRYGHLIDPKSGLPVTEPRMAVVVAKSATEAEALSKPPVILGGARGIGLIKRRFPKIEALLVSGHGAPVLSGGSSGFFALRE